MNQQIFLLFSKYSRACNNWIQKFKSCPIELKINNICVDNTMIRKKMFESPTLHISKLPCIVIYSQNKPTIYEGLLAFQWLENVTQQFLNMSKLSKETVTQSQGPPHSTPLVEEEYEEYSESDDEPAFVNNFIAKNPRESTPIGDEPSFQSGNPPKKPSVSDQKKTSLAEKIAQMQKERDNEEDKIKSVKNPGAVPSNNLYVSADTNDGDIPIMQQQSAPKRNFAPEKKRRKKIVMKSTN